MQLYSATQQWATRPADERFNSLAEMHAATKTYADSARVKDVAWNDLRVEAVDSEMSLVGRAGVPARLTHYAFGQLAARAGAPAGYLRGLPATLAAQNLNHGLKTRVDGVARLLFHQNGSLVLRAATSDVYERVWNYELVERLQQLAHGFNLTPARQTMTWDGTPLPPEAERPAALYASDHDMFAFVMSAERAVKDPVGQDMFRGIIVTNSEVGDRSLGVQRFYFRDICQNHIIWGAGDLLQISLRHVGEIRSKWLQGLVTIRQYLDADTTLETARFAELRARIADTKEGVIDALFSKRVLGLTRKAVDASYDAVVPEQDGDPRSVWGIAQGITRYSQATPYADERAALDQAAGKVLSLAF